MTTPTSFALAAGARDSQRFALAWIHGPNTWLGHASSRREPIAHICGREECGATVCTGACRGGISRRGEAGRALFRVARRHASEAAFAAVPFACMDCGCHDDHKRQYHGDEEKYQ